MRRRLLEARMGKRGKREFVRVPLLLEVFAIEDVGAGVRDGPSGQWRRLIFGRSLRPTSKNTNIARFLLMW